MEGGKPRRREGERAIALGRGREGGSDGAQAGVGKSLPHIVCRPRGICGVGLREPLLVTPRQGVYVGLCVFNLLLRFVWALSTFGGIQACDELPLLFPLR